MIQDEELVEISWMGVCLVGYYSWLVVWHPLSLDPSDSISGRFDLAALLKIVLWFLNEEITLESTL